LKALSARKRQACGQEEVSERLEKTARYSQTVVTAPDGERVCFALPNGGAIPIHPLIQQMTYEDQRIYAQAYVHAWKEALQRQGQRAFDYSKESAAIHEAGHLVIGALDGFSFAWSRIWCEDNIWLGFTASNDEDVRAGTVKPGGLATVESNLMAARYVMAGYMAERVFEGAEAREGSSLDERVTAMWLVAFAAIGAKRDTANLLHETEQLVAENLIKHEREAKDLAHALMSAYPLKLEGEKLEGLLASLNQQQ
jgi:hypothetical protein